MTDSHWGLVAPGNLEQATWEAFHTYNVYDYYDEDRTIFETYPDFIISQRDQNTHEENTFKVSIFRDDEFVKCDEKLPVHTK